MQRKTIPAITLAVLGLAAAGAQAETQRPTASAEVIDTDGAVIGTAELTQGPHGVLLRLDLEDLPGGGRYHAFHIHRHGDCSDPGEGFQASGGHLNPQGRAHGLLNPDGPDAGDFANLYADGDGTVDAEFFTPHASLDGTTGARILDDDGAALVIHARPDDHVSQPIGGAGARIACGVIEGSSGQTGE